LAELNDAIHQLLTPAHFHADLDRTGVLLEPAEFPWCTDWHRDWRDHMPEEIFEAEFREDWDAQTFDIDAMNQINCALYEDPSTWIVPGSHYRQRNLPGEVAARRMFDARKHRGAPDVSSVQRERDCMAYVLGMPGAVQLRLNAGDFALYRSSAWHMGNYVPYRKRATIHDFCGTHEWSEYVRTRVNKKDEAMARLNKVS
jgi:ectoine hydroxylase-related dioxygenase (phytanoyl-CoA dioxygenase family)